jgi:hypothetical protein
MAAARRANTLVQTGTNGFFGAGTESLVDSRQAGSRALERKDVCPALERQGRIPPLRSRYRQLFERTVLRRSYGCEIMVLRLIGTFFLAVTRHPTAEWRVCFSSER